MKKCMRNALEDSETIKSSIKVSFVITTLLISVMVASIGPIRAEEYIGEEIEISEVKEEISEAEDTVSIPLNRDFEMNKREGLDFVIEADIPSEVLSSLNDEDDLSQVLSSSDAGEGEVGAPDLPVYREWIMIPQGTSPELEISEGEPLEYDDMDIPPVQPPRPAVGPSSEMYDVDRYEPEFTKDEDIYNTDADFPGYFVDTENFGSTDGLEYMIIEKCPYQYNPVQETLSAYPDLSITVDFQGEIQRTSSRSRNSNIEEIRERLAINSESALEAQADARDRSIMTDMDETEQIMIYDDNDILSTAGGGTEGAAEYLIIAPPEFTDQEGRSEPANDLAEWKNQKGIPTYVATTEETGETADEITSYIQNAYNNWDPSPEYLLLLGDAEYIPPHYETVHSYDGDKIGTDVYYTTMEGSESEYFPDLSHGRMTVETEDQAQSRVDEIINYEKDPITSDSFYDTVIQSTEFEDTDGWFGVDDGYASRRFTQTSEDIAIFLEDEEYLGEYSSKRIYKYNGDFEPRYWNLYPYFEGGPAGDGGEPIPDHLSEDWEKDPEEREIWGGDASEVNSAVNDGAFLLTHRGHGSTSGWSNPNYDIRDVDELTNEDRLPVVWTMNCYTGYFDHETADGASHDHSFVEAWEENQDGGAIGVIASTRVSYSNHNDRLSWGITDAIWPEFLDYSGDHEESEEGPLYRMGDVLNYGKYYYSTHFSSRIYRKMTFEMFHWFGDPTMQIRTEVPEEMNLEYPDAVYEGQEIDIKVEDSSGEPVRDARLALRGDSGYYKVVETDLLGEASVEIDTSDTGEIDLTATKANFIPSEESITVGESFTATNTKHEDAGRAYSEWEWGEWGYVYYAEGSDDYLGSGSDETTLTKVRDGHYELVEEYEEPEADFTSSIEEAEKGELIEFNDESIEGENEILDWKWDFGDGSTSTDQDPTHAYEDGGTYLVKLTVTDSEDVSDSAAAEIDVIRDPEADFSFDPKDHVEYHEVGEDPVEYQVLEFSDESDSPDGVIVEWEWDFGDGSTSTEQDPTHAYEEGGTYTVELTVNDDNDNTDTFTSEDAVRVEQSPFAGGSGTEGDPWIVDDWHALDCVRKFRDDAFVLSNDIDENAEGYSEYNDRKTDTWYPIGNDKIEFTGSFDGQGYEIRDLFIDRTNDPYVGLFGVSDGRIENLGVVDADIEGGENVGPLVGKITSRGTVENSYSSGELSGDRRIGGLAGENEGNIRDSFATVCISGDRDVGGLVGVNSDLLSNSHATGEASGGENVGGLVGRNIGSVENSYSTGDVKGDRDLGGLIGSNVVDTGTVSNSHYNVDEVLINGENHITRGALFDEQYQDWIEDKDLDISDYDETLIPADDHYEIDSTDGLRDLLGFAGNSEYRFRLTADIDMTGHQGLFIPALDAEFDGQDHVISDLYIDVPFAEGIGMFGGVDEGVVKNVVLMDVDVTSRELIGGLAGVNNGRIEDSYITGEVNGDAVVGGLVGENRGTVDNSYATANVSGERSVAPDVGGLVGTNYGMVENSYTTGDVTGDNRNVGGLVGRNYEGTVENSYVTGDVTGDDDVGGLVGRNEGPVENSYTTGDVTGDDDVGGLVGRNEGLVIDSLSLRSPPIGAEEGNKIGRVADSTEEDMKNINLYTQIGSWTGPSGRKYHEMDGAWDIEVNEEEDPSIPYLSDHEAGWIIDQNISTDIYDWHDLHRMRYHLTLDYTLMNDLDETTEGYMKYNDPETVGWSPLGNEDEIFVGSFDGQEHKIEGLYMDRSDADPMGLFSCIGDEGSVNNVDLVDVDIIGGSSEEDVSTGGLAGVNNGTIEDSQVSGDVIGLSTVGGLVGNNNGLIKDSHSSVEVTGEGDSQVSGLAGENAGEVSESYATGDVSGKSQVGGLAGENAGEVSESYSIGNVSGDSQVGGLIGRNIVLIEHSYSTGNVDGDDEVGGLTGRNLAPIEDSYSIADVEGNDEVGGLVGNNDNDGTIEDSYTTGEVNGVDRSGGLIGYNAGSVTDSMSLEGPVIGEEEGSQSGRVNDSTMEDMKEIGLYDEEGTWTGPSGKEYQEMESSWDIKASPKESRSYPYHGDDDFDWVIDQDMCSKIYDWHDLYQIRDYPRVDYTLMNDLDETTEGYMDYNDPDSAGWLPIGDEDNNFLGSFDGQGHKIEGLYIERPDEDGIGLFGKISGEIRNVRVESADITGGDFVGILAGDQGDLMTNTSVHGTVSGTKNVGGLAGILTGAVENSYSSADVSGESIVGGLLGQLGRSGLIDIGGAAGNTYSYGSVNGSEVVGGLIGGSNFRSHAEASFWDVEASGQDTSADDEVGLGTEEMQSFNTFDEADWNIAEAGDPSSENTWNIIDGETYPYLSWEEGTVEEDIEADFTYTPEEPKEGETFQFTDESFSTHGTIVEWSWDFGDGETSTEQHPTHVYNEAGDYTVELKVTDDNGLSDVTNEEITVLEGEKIMNWYHLESISESLDENYELIANLDETTKGYDELVADPEKGWEPIGEDRAPFEGSFDGQGYEISDLYIDRPDEDFVGLFGAIEGSTVRDVGMVDIDIAGDSAVGGLVGGTNPDSSVSNSYATGDVSGEEEVGGLVGYNGGCVKNSYATSSVEGEEKVGGLVGKTDGISVENSYASGDVSGEEEVGGLVGYMYDSSVEDSFALEQIDTPLIGLRGRGSELKGRVTDAPEEDMKHIDLYREEGTWTGPSSREYQEMDTSWDIQATTEEDPSIPYLSDGDTRWIIDQNITTNIYDWDDLYKMRDHLNLDYTLMNDLDETTEGYIEYNDPDTAGWSPIGDEDGRFTGSFDGQGHKIEGLYIERPDEDGIGLFGEISGEIRNVRVEDADVTGDDFVGILAGGQGDLMTNTSVHGTVSGTENVGGLTGILTGTVENSYSSADVSGESIVGGLLGQLGRRGAIEIGGAAGNTYSYGSVNGNEEVGGLIGGSNFRSNVVASFWDVEASGQDTSADDEVGLGTEEMQSFNTFDEADWDIAEAGDPSSENIWNIIDGETYPYLSWEESTVEEDIEADFTYTPEEPEKDETIQLTDKSSSPYGTIVEWSWDFGDGETSTEQHPTHVYNEAGDYTVELNVTDDNGLSDVTTEEITVLEGPGADLSWTPEEPEEDEEVLFTDESTEGDVSIVEWSWNFGDGETSTEQHPTHVYNEAGDYTVVLNVTDDNGLSDVTNEEITVLEGPGAAFSFNPTEPEEEETVEFMDQSTEGDAAIAGWSWNFGDGETSTEQHPTHVYNEAGDYTVELNVTDDNGLSDVRTEEITVEEFTGEYCEVEGGDTSYDEYITNLQFNGIDRNSGDDGGYADHTDSVSDPVEPGESYVLSVTMSTGGYLDYVSVVIDWSQDQDLSNEEVIEVGGGDDDPMTVTTEITVPESAEEGETRMRVMQSYDEYHQLPCEDQEYGETEDYTVKIGSVEPHLEADFSYEPESPAEGETVQFIDESTSTGGEIVEWSWNFGDGETSTKENPTHVYEEKGDYTVELNVSADNGLLDETTKQITVEEKIITGPEAAFSFTPEEPEEDKEVQFTDESTEGDGSIVEWSWDFGDGETSTEQNPTHSFSEEGEYTVELNVTDTEDMYDTTRKEIQVVSDSEYYTAANSEHQDEGRAYREWDWGQWGYVYYAEGSDDYLGSGSEETTLKRVEEGHYELVEENVESEDNMDLSAHTTDIMFRFKEYRGSNEDISNLFFSREFSDPRLEEYISIGNSRHRTAKR